MTAADTPAGYVAPVSVELLGAIAADPGRLARVLVAAGCALNTIARNDSLDGLKDRSVTPEGTVTAVRSILRDAFTDWDTISTLLTESVALQPSDS